MATGGGQGAVFYRYRDASGRVHIVDSLDLVPSAQRARVERVQYEEPATTVGSALAAGRTQAEAHWQPFALGFAAAVALWFVFKGRSQLLRWGVVLGGAVLIAGAYFGWLRRTTQSSSAAFASPTTLIDDAKQAVEKMNARMQTEQAEIKETERAK